MQSLIRGRWATGPSTLNARIAVLQEQAAEAGRNGNNVHELRLAVGEIQRLLESAYGHPLAK